MKRCSKCILPENYPRIEFDEKGVCNFCRQHESLHYKGMESLKREISLYLESKDNKNEKYDCLFALSGGRDSSFLLSKLVKETDFKFVAYCADNGFLPETTRENIHHLTDRLGIDLVIEKHELLTKCAKHHIESWAKNPDPAMIGLFCTGCKLGIDLGLSNFAIKNNIPVIINGATPFEGKGFKKNLMKTDPKKGMSSFVQGYIFNIMKNPSWIASPKCVAIQLKEFYYHYMENWQNENYLFVYPFGSFIRWNESEVVSGLDEIGWKKTDSAKSTWRGDCKIALLKLYLYKESLGFNDRDDGLSCLIRDEQISRADALERLNDEGAPIKTDILKIIGELGIDVKQFENKLDSLID